MPPPTQLQHKCFVTVAAFLAQRLHVDLLCCTSPAQSAHQRTTRAEHELHHGSSTSSEKEAQLSQKRSWKHATQHPRYFAAFWAFWGGLRGAFEAASPQRPARQLQHGCASTLAECGTLSFDFRIFCPTIRANFDRADLTITGKPRISKYKATPEPKQIVKRSGDLRSLQQISQHDPNKGSIS